MDEALVSKQFPAALCESCRRLDLESLILADEDTPSNGRFVLHIDQKVASQNCTLCKFLLALNPQDPMQDFSIRLYKSRLLGPSSTFLCALPEWFPSPPDFVGFGRHYLARCGLVVYEPQSLSKRSRSPVSDIDKLRVDYDYIRGIVSNCTICRRLRPLNQGAPKRLIDCIENSIVQTTWHQRYFALSYVWGTTGLTNAHGNYMNTTSNHCSAFGFSFESSPLTVRDAMSVVRSLGERYLWVDRYCIDQNDAEEKYSTLNAMDQIYENALATIVNLHGANDEAGLPGVSQTARKPQPVLDMKFGRLLSTGLSLGAEIQNSVWATRGWTYQEARLSRKCLFFTETQVFISCSAGTSCESVRWTGTNSWLSSIFNAQDLDSSLFNQMFIQPSGFCEDRLAYTGRKLTYESDALNAFRGVLHRLPFKFFSGIPCAESPSTLWSPDGGISMGLLWKTRPSSLCNFRRPGFPTWSWLSVTGEIVQDSPGYKSAQGTFLSGDKCFFDATTQAPLPITETRFLPISEDSNCMLRPPDATEHNPWNTAWYKSSPDSRFLLVHGRCVKVTSSQKTGRYKTELPGRSATQWAFFESFKTPVGMQGLDFVAYYDLGEDRDNVAAAKSRVEEALVLVNWDDTEDPSENNPHKGMKRFVMMLLEWIDGTHAERRGLLGESDNWYDSVLLDQIPSVQKTFFLQ